MYLVHTRIHVVLAYYRVYANKTHDPIIARKFTFWDFS